MLAFPKGPMSLLYFSGVIMNSWILYIDAFQFSLVLILLGAQIFPSSASGSPFKLFPVSFVLTPGFCDSFLSSWYNKMLQDCFVYFLSQNWNLPSFQGVPIPFRWKSYLETTSWALGMLFTSGLSLCLGPLSKQEYIVILEREKVEDDWAFTYISWFYVAISFVLWWNFWFLMT